MAEAIPIFPLIWRRRHFKAAAVFWLLTGFLAGLAIIGASTAQAITFRFSSIGYHTQGSKVVVVDEIPDNQPVRAVLYDPMRRNPKFPVLLGAVVYKFDNPPVFSNPAQTGPPTKSLLLDFSDFKEAGTYEIRLEGTDTQSPPLRVSDFLYWDALKPVVKTFYFQRSGQEIEDRFLNLYHAASHTQDADAAFDSRPGADRIDVAGGWYNGGDYAKYATSTALSAARLMGMSEWNSKPWKFFRLEYPLSEPGYGSTDDLHHEIRAGLDWLMAMQRKDGSVYRKVAGKTWPGTIMPEDDDQTRYIFGVTTQDTAAAAAAFAIAARDFRKPDLGYSVKCLLHAEKAWDFLAAHPQPIRPAPDFSGSGEFMDFHNPSDTPWRLWAAAELYTATGKDVYHQAFLSMLKDVPLQRVSWRNPALLGITDYLFYAANPDPKTAGKLKNSILDMANDIVRDIQHGAWPSGLKQYARSSNQEVLERDAILLSAWKLSGKPLYRDAASSSLNYLFGVNPLGMSYVTASRDDPQGVKSVHHPVHRWMMASDKLIPGYLVDGPNAAATDGKTPRGMGALSYIDEDSAQDVNEPTIINNASLAYVLAVLNDAYNVNSDNDDNAPKSPLDFQLAPERPVRKK